MVSSFSLFVKRSLGLRMNIKGDREGGCSIFNTVYC